MKVTKLNVKSSSDKKNRKNALPRTIGLILLSLGVALSSFGLWTHFHGESGPTIATYKDDNVYVTASYGEDANIPKDAEMRAYLVTPETDPDEYSQKVMSAITAIGGDDETAAENVIYDIGFYVGDAEIEPAAPVEVTIQDLNDGFTAGEDIAVVHLGEDDVELLADASVDGNGILSFTSDRFSEFVLLSDSVLLADNDGDYYGIVTTAETETGLVAHFPLDGNLENSVDGSKVTAKGEGNFGKYSDGISGQSIDFTGKNGGYIKVEGLKEIDFSQGATISYWSMIYNTSNPNWGYVWGSQEKDNDYTGVIQGNSYPGKIRLEGAHYTRKTGHFVEADGYNDDHVWHQITVVYSPYDNTKNEQKMELYVDGESKGTSNLNVANIYLRANTNTGKNLKYLPFYVGYNGTYNEYTEDWIDELKIYNYALSAEEIKAALMDGRPAIVWFDGTLGDGAGNNYGNYYKGAENRLADANEFIKNEAGVLCVKLPETMSISEKYNYKLAGWYDIYAGEYYKPGALVPITELGDDSSDNTVFYADWWATDYNFTDTKTKVAEDRFADANTFISTNVFDYNELYNVGNAKVTKNSLSVANHKEKWEKTKDIVFQNWFQGGGNTGQLSFLGNEDKTNDDDAGRGSEGYYLGKITPNLWKFSDGLFTPNSSLGVNYLGNGRSLYQYDDNTGYYYYDSKLNAASYNQSDGRFYVYNATEKVKTGSSKSDFLPFNVGKSEYVEKDGSVNYWFGFSSTISFNLPGDVATEDGRNKNRAEYDKDMSFTFSGDDDVWVFVDGTLILDMGGVHDVVFGSINFATGEVLLGDNAVEVLNQNYYSENPGTPPGVSGEGTRTEAAASASAFIKTLTAGDHTLTICYMERGSSQANCAVYFNLCPSAGVEIEKKDDMTGELLEGAGFTLKDSNGKYYYLNETTGLVEWTEEPTTYYTDEDGVLRFGSLPVGTYKLNEIEAPSGYKLDSSDVTLTVSQRSGTRKAFEFTVTPMEGMNVEGSTEDSVTLSISFPNKPDYLPLQIVKYGGDAAESLAGAEFNLYVQDEEAEGGRILLGTLISDGNGSLIFTNPNSVTRSECQIGDGGKLEGLMIDRTYYLVETKAPNGYELLPEVKFKVSENDIELVDVTDEDNVVKDSRELSDALSSNVAWSETNTLFILKLTDPKKTVKLALIKVDDQTKGLLAGATFEIYGSDYYNSDGTVNDEASALWTGTSVEDADNGSNFTWVDKDGKSVDFPELAAGEIYYLVEKAAPEQYNKLDSVIKIKVALDGEVTVSSANDGEDELGLRLDQVGADNEETTDGFADEDVTIVYDYVLTVPNSTGYELPETGGHGTLIYLLTGLMLVLGSTIVLVTKRRLRCTQ